MINLNIEEKFRKTDSILTLWEKYPLSLKGKITVLKCLVMPHILHIASVLYIDSEIIKKLEDMFFDFLWTKGRHAVKKVQIIQSIENGGMKMVSISNMIRAAKIMFIKCLLDDFDTKWKYLSWFMLGISKYKLFSKLEMRHVSERCISSFYRQVLEQNLV